MAAVEVTPSRSPVDSVRAACEAMLAEGRAWSFGEVAASARMSRQALFRHPQLREMVNEARARAAAGRPAVAKAPPKDSRPARLAPVVDLRPSSVPPVADLAAAWVADRLERGRIGPRSADAYMERLRLFSRAIPAVEGLDRASLGAWQRSLARRGQSTKRAYVSTVAQFLKGLHVEGYTDDDLSVHLTPVREPRSVPRALAASDAGRVLEVCGRRLPRDGITVSARREVGLRDGVIVSLMLGCGLRCMEVAALDLDDYDRDAGTIFVNGKGGHQRVLPVPAGTARAIAAYVEQRGTVAGPLLLGVGSKSPSDRRMTAKAVSKRLGLLMAAAGVHKAGDGRSAHALRHTAASDVLDRCLDLRVVQQMLGHASLATTERYLRRADLGRLRAAMEGRDYSAGGGAR